MPRYTVVLLDADNTLFDFDRAEGKALVQALTQQHLPATEAVVARYIALNSALWERFALGEISQSFLVVERFAALLRALGSSGDAQALNRAYLARLAEQNDLLPGALEFCAALAPHCRLALVTNGVASVQHGRLSRSPLGRFFPEPFISEELGVQKPQREFFEAVFRALDLSDTARTVMVGDNLHSDILGGIGAGLDTIWFNPKGLPPRADVVPSFTAPDFATLASIILDE